MDHDFGAPIDACAIDSPGDFNHLMREISADPGTALVGWAGLGRLQRRSQEVTAGGAA